MNNFDFSLVNTKEIKVNGMTCGHCKMKVEKAISSIEGVVGVEVDLIDASAEIQFTNNLDMNVVVKQVKEAGFEVV